MGIVGQTLIPLKDKEGRVLATEILIPTISIRNIIRRGALMEIRGQMVTGEAGMYSLEQNLSSMVKDGILPKEYAKEFTKFPAFV